MTIEMTATEAKAKLLKLLDQVAAGQEVTITKHGRTVGALGAGPRSPVSMGQWSGIARSVPDDELLFSTGVDWEAS